jgi:hypothetical protein
MAFEQKQELAVYHGVMGMPDEKRQLHHIEDKFYFAPSNWLRVNPFSGAFDTEEQAWAAAAEYAERNKDMLLCSAAGKGLH